MIAFDEAMALLAEHIAPLDAETIALSKAAGRTLAADITAAIPSPRCTISAMDGYAVRLSSVVPETPMRVVGEARPGHAHAGRLEAGMAVRIFTGAPLPEGADCVIMQEYASRAGDDVRFSAGFGPARHIRQQGSDFAKGDVVLEQGTSCDPKALVAIAAADRAEIAAHRQPRVALLATGDELVEPGSAESASDAIPDSTSYALAALVEREGGVVTARERGLDDLPALERQAGALLGGADLVVVTGGASVGERDFAKPMFAPHGLELVFDKVAIKPGKPVWLGRAGGTLVLGLPGNPTSAMVTARLFLQPILALLQGASTAHRWRTMLLAEGLPATGDRETFARAAWVKEGLRPLGNQDSGVQGRLARADWLVRCPPGQAELPAGAMVEALPF
ncbi:molybdopterin molybdotransferase MoeA [Qipengyuania sp. SS22]|uniref:molybdopterin molybdotransferase MoeA n=1 Tax=Qipengyuania sp. SS22 TaxID=2979461 RepID=UPI0021E60551|nr:gephyrin-like molybdotransferase Glp [Qipengyuania sp. SS22]UYH55560.1 molybdopterin molybdotransferase MoeA [Qipengyuania sp. SS22]